MRATRYWDNNGQSHARGLKQKEDLGVLVMAGLAENVDVNIRSGYSWLKDADNDFTVRDGLTGPHTGRGAAA